MIICQICKLDDVRIKDGNFALKERDGEPTPKHTYSKYFFNCENCGNQWESTPNEEKDHHEYKWLKDKTRIIGGNMGRDGSYGPANQIDLNDDSLRRGKELANKIFTSYRHLLNLSIEEWNEIEEDACSTKCN